MLKKINFFNFIFFIIPLSFVIGPLILELSLIYISYFFLKDILRKNNFEIFNNFFSKIFFSFSTYLIISMLIFSRYDQGLSYSLLYFRYGIYILAIYYFLKKNELLIEKFLLIFLYLNFFLIFDAIFQNYFGHNIFGFDQIDPYRVSSLFGDELVLGSFIHKISPLIFSLAFIKEKNLSKPLLISIIIISFLNLYVISISGGRSSLFMYCAYCIFLFIFLKFNYLKKLIFLSLLFVSIFSIFSFNENVLERVVKKTYFEFTGNSISKKKDPYNTDEYYKLDKLPFFIFSAAHTNYYVTSLKIFNDNKYFGSGPKSYRELCKEEKYSYGRYSCSTHSHNYYIQLLAETGILGLIFLLIAYFSLLILLYKVIFSKDLNKNKKNYCIVLIGGLLINFFPFMPTGNFFNNWNSILILLPIVFLLRGFKYGK